MVLPNKNPYLSVLFIYCDTVLRDKEGTLFTLPKFPYLDVSECK